MADTKITSLLTPQVTTNPATDVLPIVNIADTSMASSGSTRKITVNTLLGAGGTATLASATITGDLTVDTSTLKVDSTNNRVGIGIATPSNQLHVKATGSTPALIETSGGALAYLQFTSTTGSAYIGNNANGLGFYTTGSADLRMSLAAAGDLSITSGNVVMATSGKGIDFSATTSGSGTMTSELLNDYEEGTWTIGLTFGGGSTGITTTGNTGRYTKVGRQVTVSGILSLSNKGSSTGLAEITGLPFTIANSNEAYSAASVRFNGISFADVPICIGATNSTKILLQEITNAGAVTDLTDADFTNTSSCVISLTYTV